VTPITDDYIKKHPDFKVSNMSYEDFREDLDNLLKNIENGSNRINRIVCDLKEFSKRKDAIKRDWFDLNKIIEKAVTICGSKINGLTDSIERKGTKDLSPVYCDHEIVELILVNFLKI
jgi:K+-sensing histidine kinase KdpD